MDSIIVLDELTLYGLQHTIVCLEMENHAYFHSQKMAMTCLRI